MESSQRTKGLRTWIEIDTQALANNYAELRKIAGSAKMMAVVKSNAYGHGLFEFSLELQKLGIDWLGVDSIVEALRLREEAVTVPILVLGYTLPERVAEAVENNISLTASTFEFLNACVELNLENKINIHVKADTGLHRQGFLENQIKDVTDFFAKHASKFFVEGLYTHFAKAKDPTNRDYTKKQLESFNLWFNELKNAGFAPITHAGATAGTLLYPEAHFDMIRSGAGLYGIWPSKLVESELGKKIKFTPVLSWRTLVTECKKLPKGLGIGYDLAHVLDEDSVIAICPIGYWHGFPRSLSSVGEVLVNGMRAKVLGRVAMDMIVIDVTHVADVRVGSVVTLIGRDGNEAIRADEVADKAGTTDYEILTRLNPLIKKIYV